MQAVERDGTERMVELFSKKRINELLDDPKVKEVKVFRLELGQRVTIRGTVYKVISARNNGKVTMKPV